ncbi:MAG: hypothetical protein H6634_13335 [Anaerolineales bacterium]|nr:hypothetical protein [Anaerolineales bacterium]
MLKFLLYLFLIANPVGIAIVEFIVWELFSNGRWKERQRQSNPALYWQNQALAATRELRESQMTSRRQMDALQSKFRMELKQKEREIKLS